MNRNGVYSPVFSRLWVPIPRGFRYFSGGYFSHYLRSTDTSVFLAHFGLEAGERENLADGVLGSLRYLIELAFGDLHIDPVNIQEAAPSIIALPHDGLPQQASDGLYSLQFALRDELR